MATTKGLAYSKTSEKSDFFVSVTLNKKGMNESFTILIVFCRWAFGVVVWEIVTLGKNQGICH